MNTGIKIMFSNLLDVRKVQVKSCPTLCDPMNCSLRGSSTHVIFLARVLEWVAISFSILDTYLGVKLLGNMCCVCTKSFQSCPALCDPMNYSWPENMQLSMGFSRQEYWSGLPCSPPGDLPDPWIKPPVSLMSHALAGGLFTTSAIWKVHWVVW